MQNFMWTIREVLRTEFPQDASGRPACVGDREIMAFWHGDKQLVGQATFPVIAIDADNRPTEHTTFRARKHTFNISILCYVKEEDSEVAQTVLNDMARIVDKLVSHHPRLWLFDRCLFDGDLFKNPSHLATGHAELDPYAAAVQAEWGARFNATHQVQGTDTPPSPPTLDSGTKYALALYKFYNEATSASTTPFTYMDEYKKTHTTNANANLIKYREKMLNPVRLVSFVTVDDIQYGYSPKLDAQYLRAAEVKVSCREIDPMQIFTLGNVT